MGIKRLLIYTAVLIMNLVLNCVYFENYMPFGLKPDSIIAVVIAVSLVSGSLAGGAYGFIAGIVMDILFSRYLGMYALGYMLVGLLAGLFSRQYYAHNLIFPPVIAVFLSLLKEGILVLQMSIAGASYVMGNAFWRYILPSSLLTAVLTIPVYYFYRRRNLNEMRRSRWENYPARIDRE